MLSIGFVFQSGLPMVEGFTLSFLNNTLQLIIQFIFLRAVFICKIQAANTIFFGLIIFLNIVDWNFKTLLSLCCYFYYVH